MGAGVVKPGGNGERHSFSLSNGDMVCTACAISFNIFTRRKKICFTCGKHHCSDCLVREPARPTSRRRCNKCRVLTSHNLQRHDLMQLKVKDLRDYLQRRQVTTQNCTEKQDLVDLVLKHFGGESYQEEQRERRRHVAQLRERNRTEFGSPTLDDDSEQISDDITTDDQQIDEAEFDESSVPDPHQPVRRMVIENVLSEDHIHQLSVRQLKELLVNNFVNYRGCCEKAELVERVIRLYHDYQNNAERRASVMSGGTDEENDDLCKICMDATIDCVLLECGHMVACSKCGKQLSECPICRQYVVRAVHIFRA